MSLLREELHRAQLVARARDGDGVVEHGHAHHVELAHDREAVVGDRRADARDDEVDARQRPVAEEQRRAARARRRSGSRADR